MLETLQRYVHWVDIGLVANSTFAPLLFTVLGSPSEHIRWVGNAPLAGFCGWAFIDGQLHVRAAEIHDAGGPTEHIQWV